MFIHVDCVRQGKKNDVLNKDAFSKCYLRTCFHFYL
jgi:hypothetical protein